MKAPKNQQRLLIKYISKDISKQLLEIKFILPQKNRIIQNFNLIGFTPIPNTANSLVKHNKKT